MRSRGLQFKASPGKKFKRDCPPSQPIPGYRWHTPVIIAIQEAENGKIMVSSQSGQMFARP
jgi:hypothetical protein